LGKIRIKSCIDLFIYFFFQYFLLFKFPADVQDLTVSISSHHQIENCVLIPDENLRSSINREAFFDQQEWKLYEHVATELRQTQEEYSFQDENNEIEQKKHPVLAVTCRAGLYLLFLNINTTFLFFI